MDPSKRPVACRGGQASNGHTGESVFRQPAVSAYQKEVTRVYAIGITAQDGTA